MTALTNQIAVVTGGSRGYGRGIATMLIMAGAKVWITGRDQAALRSTADQIGAQMVVADVAAAADWDRLFATVLESSGGRLDVLVNNAGAGCTIKPLAEQNDRQIEQSIAINLTGQLYGMQRSASLMHRQGSGLIINIASVCATHAWPGFAVYSAAKAGMLQAARCLDTELRSKGVRVTTILPSWGQTEFTEAAGLGSRDADVASRCIAPDELGRIVTDLCTLPAHLVVQELTLWPTVQDVMPL